MNLKEFLKLNPPNNDKGFGVFVKQRREELGLTLKDFADLSGISTPYLCDIENGERYAPLNYLDVYQEILQLPQADTELFLDLAYCTRHNHPDINNYLNDHPKAREFLRIAKRKNLSDKDLTDLILSVKDLKNAEITIMEEEIEK